MPDTITKKPLHVIITIYIVLLIVIAIGVYLIKNNTKTSPALLTTKSCQYDPAVCLFLEKLQNPNQYYQGAFTASILTTKANGISGRVIIKTDQKNNLTIISYKENILFGESIIIGNTVYIRDIKTDTWRKSPNVADTTFRNFKQKSLAQVSRSGNTITYTFLGESSCGKFQCIKYEVSSDNVPTGKEYILFDKDTHILRSLITKDAQNLTTETTFFYTPVIINQPTVL